MRVERARTRCAATQRHRVLLRIRDSGCRGTSRSTGAPPAAQRRLPEHSGRAAPRSSGPSLHRRRDDAWKLRVARGEAVEALRGPTARREVNGRSLGDRPSRSSRRRPARRCRTRPSTPPLRAASRPVRGHAGEREVPRAVAIPCPAPRHLVLASNEVRGREEPAPQRDAGLGRALTAYCPRRQAADRGNARTPTPPDRSRPRYRRRRRRDRQS